MNNFNTHTIVNHRSGTSAILVRNSDGMIIAAQTEQMVGYGENPEKQEKRLFRTQKHAKAYLRVIADHDFRLGEGAFSCRVSSSRPGEASARIEEEDGDNRIIQ